ncbi:MAG: hypothetical protein R8K49_00800 [Mariprofundaceae bacterium]
MSRVKWTLPLWLAAVVIMSGFGFVSYFNSYEEVGEHWTPKSPIAHETARFSTDMGAEGDYLLHIEKLSSKLPLLFVEYQTPGLVLDLTVHSDDGMVHLSQQFADEGLYRISVQHLIHPNHKEVIDFTVQTPLVKYSNDILLFVFLLLAGFVSGKHLRGLAVLLVVVSSGMVVPDQAFAHSLSGEHQVMEVGADVDDVQLAWLHGRSPMGEANRSPMDWSLTIHKAGKLVKHAAYDLDFVHLESGLPVLHVEGVANNGVIALKYSPPDGTDYQLQLRTVIEGRVYHLALRGSAEAIHPTASRQWASFLLMMIPVLIGMVWGWKRGKHG